MKAFAALRNSLSPTRPSILLILLLSFSFQLSSLSPSHAQSTNEFTIYPGNVDDYPIDHKAHTRSYWLVTFDDIDLDGHTPITMGIKTSLSDTTFYGFTTGTVVDADSGQALFYLPASSWVTNITSDLTMYGGFRLANYDNPLQGLDIRLKPSGNWGNEGYAAPTHWAWTTNGTETGASGSIRIIDIGEGLAGEQDGETLTITAPSGAGDITAVVAGDGLSGGAESGEATLSVDVPYLETQGISTNPASAAQGVLADGALPKSGGTMTGDLTLDDGVGASPALRFENADGATASLVVGNGAGQPLTISAAGNIFINAQAVDMAYGGKIINLSAGTVATDAVNFGQLGDAAFSNATDFATGPEGDLASTALQSESDTLQSVVTRGGTVTNGVVTIDNANARTNTVGGYLVQLGDRVQMGAGIASGDRAFAAGGGEATGFSSFACGTGSDATGQGAFGCGYSSLASGLYSWVGGYDCEASGANSVAWGRYATASHQDSFVWSGGWTNATSSAAGQFTVRATGGIRLLTSPTEGVDPTEDAHFVTKAFADANYAGGGGGGFPVTKGNFYEEARTLKDPNAAPSYPWTESGVTVYVAALASTNSEVFWIDQLAAVDQVLTITGPAPVWETSTNKPMTNIWYGVDAGHHATKLLTITNVITDVGTIPTCTQTNMTLAVLTNSYTRPISRWIRDKANSPVEWGDQGFVGSYEVSVE
jgi:hypothetical protein